MIDFDETEHEMTIKGAKGMKSKLISNINDLILEFEQRTGLAVTDIRVNRVNRRELIESNVGSSTVFAGVSLETLFD